MSNSYLNDLTDKERAQLQKTLNYWGEDRLAKAQAKLTEKTRKQIDTRLRKYYKLSAKAAIKDFEDTLDKVLNTVADGVKPTPADLYKLDKYWQLQAQLRENLRKLGERQVTALTKQFQANYFDIYYSISLDGLNTFNTLDDAAVEQMINSIWCADGKSWSARVWENTEKLAQELNDGLITCVASGSSTRELVDILQERFNVSFGRADALVRTELAHIQTEAAKKRYEDYGIREVEVFADEDERRCPICAKLHKKRIPITAQMPIPAHPRCRCCVIPVVE